MHSSRTTVDLSTFNNDWYDPGRGWMVRLMWIAINRAFFLSAVPWPSAMKASILRAFGARVGLGVVIRPRVNIKYPWNVGIGDHSWIGEGVWLDSLGRIEIGKDACLSQGVMVETGNHDWSKTTFDLFIRAVTIEDGAWAAVRSLLLPGSILAASSVLGAGSVLVGPTDANCIYRGNPAVFVGARQLSEVRGPVTPS
jgi:putative colanic acid biosynthesis acetyltransferase WcaF